jgi:hypothetical protein
MQVNFFSKLATILRVTAEFVITFEHRKLFINAVWSETINDHGLRARGRTVIK